MPRGDRLASSWTRRVSEQPDLLRALPWHLAFVFSLFGGGRGGGARNGLGSPPPTVPKGTVSRGYEPG